MLIHTAFRQTTVCWFLNSSPSTSVGSFSCQELGERAGVCLERMYCDAREAAMMWRARGRMWKAIRDVAK
ncbi:hypothetical protein PVAP13_9KG257113 [Panicum virgatum]|uniref:Uncharacterized protein n=1 Tax=Panicum virgatum TaxID=38727 RepID=A0A8T0NR58_PANVG|nr:hypothetical protein PVAP13_9KG257113 [Panicum virgatum]